MNSAEVLIKFKGDTKDAEKSTQSMSASLGQLTKSFTLGSLAAKAITKTLGVMTSNMDSAIRRVDIMNNFPRVMENLGISAEDSAEVIKDLSKQLQGLPTTMDSAAAAVQRFTSKNGDVKQSEKLFLALNNAILSGGAGADIQATAMEQISQAYAKGKPDMMEWRSLMTAMPAQLKQVAQAMGYTDAALLGEAVRAKGGEKEFSRMMDTMMRMNTEGVNGFKSFDEQARAATGGIQTSITNMKTAFVRGVANMITKIDEALQPFGGLKGVIQEIGKVGEQVFTKIGDVLANQVIPFFIETAEQIQKNRIWLEPLAVAILAAVAAFKTVSTVISIINAAKTAFALLNAVMMANPIGVVIALIAALVAVFIYVWNHCETFRNFWIGLWESIKQVVAMWVDGFKIMINGIVSFFGGIINWFKGMFNNWINGWRLMLNFIAGVPGAIINFFTSLPGKMLNVGLDIVKGIGRGITNGVSWLKNRIREFVGNVTSFIKKMFKIGSPSKLMAQQVGQWLPKGIGVGITANTDSVYDAMDEMQEGIMSTYGLSPQMTNSMGMHYSPNVNVYNNVDVSTDPLGQTVSQIKTFSGGARNDYNYGMGA
jgi:tape measure domain-containing protein